MKRLWLSAIIVVSLLAGCATAKTDLIRKMLATKGLTRETARYSPEMLELLASSQALMQPHFMRYWKNPWELPKFASSLMGAQIEACGKPEGIYELFVLSTVRTGHKVTGYLQFAPVFKPKTDKPLREAYELLCKRCEVACAEDDLKKLDAATASVPAELRMCIAKCLFAAGEAKYYRDRSLREFPKEKWQEAFGFAAQAWRSDQGEGEGKYENGPVLNWDIGRRMDFDDLYQGAVAALVAIMDMEKFIANPVAEQKSPEGQYPAKTEGKNQKPQEVPEPSRIDIANLQFEFDTPLGKVAFNSRNEKNTYQGADYLLIVDIAGDDSYRGATAATCKIEHPLSIVLDWAGNDEYVSDDKTPCSQGAGILGYGLLIDNGGDDVFKAGDNAQGACYFGVGILWSRGGNDKFEARHAAQGSASFGIANLVKKGGEPVAAGGAASTKESAAGAASHRDGSATGAEKSAAGAASYRDGSATGAEKSAAGAASYKTEPDGDDSYYCWSEGQGFGYVGGYGCLIDTGGDDKYVAEPYKLFRPGTGGHDNLRNYNFCQGAGWGQRGDISGGHSMAGGTGVLQDLGGDDWYECGVYGQATGYWYGTGILHDRAGTDHYEGSFFVQSGTAHMGLTVLLDDAGNDTYHVWHAISVAGAHDISVSWFIDKGGDDVISSWEWKDAENKQSIKPTEKKDSGGGCVVGSSVANSIAVYVNIGGNDRYDLYVKEALGWGQHRTDTPTSWRHELFNIAMFLDVGGDDVYDLRGETPDWPKAGNDKKWVRISPPGNPAKTFSMGVDVEKGAVPEAAR